MALFREAMMGGGGNFAGGSVDVQYESARGAEVGGRTAIQKFLIKKMRERDGVRERWQMRWRRGEEEDGEEMRERDQIELQHRG